MGDCRPLSPQGHRFVRLFVPDGERGPARRHGRTQRAVPPHPRTVGFLFRTADDRTVDVPRQQRCRPGPAGRLGDSRRSGARVARADWTRRAAVLLRRVAGGLLLHQRAADRLPALRLGQRVRRDNAPQPGGARAVVPCQRRSVHGAPDRESVWKRRQGSREVRQRRHASLSHEHEGGWRRSRAFHR